MTQAKSDLDLDEDFVTEPEQDEARVVETPVAKAAPSLAKRRVIDNLLEERRLRRQLDDYDYDV